MATLILGAAGAAIGGSIGGAVLGVSAATIGGFIGSTIGSVVDSWIISSLAPTQRIEGARLDTLRIRAEIDRWAAATVKWDAPKPDPVLSAIPAEPSERG